jgi:hypothetical protein
MNPQVSRKLDSSSVAARLGMCAAALAGTAATVSDANAVVVTTFANTAISIPADVDGVYLNFLTGATGTAGASVAGWDFNPFLTASVFTLFWNNTAPSVSGGVASAITGGTYTALTAGAVVSSASIFSASSGAGGAAATAAFQTAGSHILGFKFYNEAAAATNYGYVTINNGATAGFPATITGWVYENSGAGITVSAVPEPESVLMFSLGALAVGATSLRRLRRERRNQAH